MSFPIVMLVMFLVVVFVTTMFRIRELDLVLLIVMLEDHITLFTHNTHHTHSVHTNYQQQLRIKYSQNKVTSSFVDLLIMVRVTKAEALMELARLGELPPKTWTAVEVIARMEEVRELHGLPRELKMAPTKTPLRQLVVRMNIASRKKADLSAFMKEVGVVHYPNDTIKTMQQRTLMALYDKTAPCGQDPVGFGMHASLSYEECMQKDPQYGAWVQATYQEGQCDPRLARFARWLEQQENPKYMGEATSSQPIPVETLIEKGYIKESKVKKAVPSMTSEGSSAGSVTSSQWMQTTEMIKSLAEVVTSLKEEIKEMKSTPEPPRKGAKGEKSPRSTGSYEKVDLVVKQG